VIQGKVQTTANQELEHAKTAFRTIYGETRLGQRQTLTLMQSLREIRTVVFDPLPILGPSDPASMATRAVKGSQILIQLSRYQFRCFANRTVHSLLLSHSTEGLFVAKNHEKQNRFLSFIELANSPPVLRSFLRHYTSFPDGTAAPYDPSVAQGRNTLPSGRPCCIVWPGR
jgi:hypothetical protein